MIGEYPKTPDEPSFWAAFGKKCLAIPAHKKIVLVGTTIFIIMGLFPAWHRHGGAWGAPYGFIGDSHFHVLDWPRTLIPMGLVVVATLVGAWVTKK